MKTDICNWIHYSTGHGCCPRRFSLSTTSFSKYLSEIACRLEASINIAYENKRLADVEKNKLILYVFKNYLTYHGLVFRYCRVFVWTLHILILNFQKLVKQS